MPQKLPSDNARTNRPIPSTSRYAVPGLLPLTRVPETRTVGPANDSDQMPSSLSLHLSARCFVGTISRVTSPSSLPCMTDRFPGGDLTAGGFAFQLNSQRSQFVGFGFQRRGTLLECESNPVQISVRPCHQPCKMILDLGMATENGAPCGPLTTSSGRLTDTRTSCGELWCILSPWQSSLF